MRIILKQLELIERVDQLIRLQATGSATEFASKLAISKTSLYRVFRIMKTLNGAIVYDTVLQSYRYVEEVQFSCGFYPSKLFINKTTEAPSSKLPFFQNIKYPIL